MVLPEGQKEGLPSCPGLVYWAQFSNHLLGTCNVLGTGSVSNYMFMDRFLILSDLEYNKGLDIF